MKKLKKEIRYSNMHFEFIKEVKGLRMFINDDEDYCIIIDKDNNVLFEISSGCSQNTGYLQDATD